MLINNAVDHQYEELLNVWIVDWADANAQIDLECVKEGVVKDLSFILSLDSATDSDKAQHRTWVVVKF